MKMLVALLVAGVALGAESPGTWQDTELRAPRLGVSSDTTRQTSVRTRTKIAKGCHGLLSAPPHDSGHASVVIIEASGNTLRERKTWDVDVGPKGGGDELRALRELKRQYKSASPFVFVPERGRPFTPSGSPNLFLRLTGAPIALTECGHCHSQHTRDDILGRDSLRQRTCLATLAVTLSQSGNEFCK